MAAKSTPENGPRITTDRGNQTHTEILVERSSKHPDGPGVTVITVSEPKKR